MLKKMPVVLEKINSFLIPKRLHIRFFQEYWKSLNPQVENRGIVYDASTVWGLQRGEATYSLEKDLISFIDIYLEENDIAYDIGANVGAISLYMAKKLKDGNGQVFAFEPESQNYAIINKNIYLNRFDNLFCYPFAINDNFSISTLNLQNFEPGTSHNQFDVEVDSNHEKFVPEFKQGMLGITLKDIVTSLPFPNFIKIDVDGNEYKIVEEMERNAILDDERLKCISIEINKALHIDMEIVERIKRHGFVELEKTDSLANEYYDSKGIINVFFVRNVKTKGQ